MGLPSRIETGSRGILDLLNAINNASMPSGNPVADPELEALAGPSATAGAAEAYKRQYAAQRAKAVQNGASWYNVDALAAGGAQDSYTDSLSKSAQALDMLQKRRDGTGRRAALEKMLAGISDPQQRAVAEANPDAYTESAIKDQFRPQSENFSMTAIGDGTIAILDKRDGKHTIVRDEASVKALKNNVASVTEANDGTLYVVGRDGQVINKIAGGPDLKAAAAAEKDHATAIRNTRRQFDALDAVKNYRTVVPIIESVKNAPDTAAGDLDLVYAVGKILDPGSVVREGEMGMVLKTGSLMEQIMGQSRFQLKGKGRIDPGRRAALIAAVQGRVDALRQPYLQTKAQYEGYATEDGFDPKRIVGEDALDAFAQPSSGAARAFATEAEAEAAGVKPGTRVIIGGVPGVWE